MSSSPSKRDRTRPVELLGLAGIFAVFVGGFALLFSRQWQVSLILTGITFIVSLIVLAMLMLTVNPDAAPPVAGRDEGAEPAAPGGAAGPESESPEEGSGAV